MIRVLFQLLLVVTVHSIQAQPDNNPLTIRIVDTFTEQPIEAKIDIFDSSKVNLDTTIYYLPDSDFTSINYDRKKLTYIEVRAYGYKKIALSIDPHDDLSKLVVYAEEVLPMGNFQIPNIYFSYDEAKLDDDAYQKLESLVDVLHEESGLSLIAEGHTDAEGSESYNYELGLSRAEAVKEFLVEKGIDPERIEIQSSGESSPVTSNSTSEDRQINRRVEFKILSN